jgi:hypothetical protein
MAGGFIECMSFIAAKPSNLSALLSLEIIIKTDFCFFVGLR